MKKISKIVAMIILVAVIVSATGCTGKKAETNSLRQPIPVETQAPAVVGSDDANNLKGPIPADTQAPAIVGSSDTKT
jgi:hypothetical protein